MTKQSLNKGIQLKFAREYRGYTQSELCKKIKGLKQSNLSKYEKGFDGMIKDNKIADIMELLNFPINFLNVKMSNLYTSWNL